MRLLLAITLSLCLALAPTRGPVQAAVTIASGHVDAVAVRVEGSALRLYVKDSRTLPPSLLDPAEVTFVVGSAARVTLPDDPAFSFLGQAGGSVWVLPQAQNPALLWPGWNAEDIQSGALAGNAVTWSLVSVQGPGAFALFVSDQFGKPVPLFNSANGLPDSTSIAVGSHAHGNWSFSSPGTYALTFAVSATLASGQPVSASATYRFVVEGSAPAPPPAPTATPAPPPPPPEPTAASPSPAAPTIIPATQPVNPAAPTGVPATPPAEQPEAQAPEPTPSPSATPTARSAATATATATAAAVPASSDEGGGSSRTPLVIGGGAIIAVAAIGAFFVFRRNGSRSPE